MNIILADHYGLCFGVRDALRDAERLAAQGPMTTLGELVHNPVALASASTRTGRASGPAR